ncbi:2-succinyl-5-enolpyruvyl-6-hydroxy-3-cyclohexene-1-carboxylate synthase [Aquiflexum balticum DSM 16537]|uniref:2-succinyl-5-enolpyruvyl-6-hydroxy-3-cyclohexene-1-carboxylate synthase n=1 Tax=Aquiflexum balticum DSM 16537 TaxID=758820 RepID=A0A1W2H5W5_9BACT|nr:2-succinyl-5-enolpyruvyl-6-hydroxy-3-cyclohexene-1-carboxylic-acid synthase [Aquiflexum balticum]SMD44008.1 2-succinyl-5-enolpyruvyl-6-hydroxy-3-cyclohexene-1-carboxylate synthase [Aquiflexum balticum DSM 16537]
MIIQPITDLVSLCHIKGITEAILSPGSRCAPITLAFTRHSGIHSRTISDERSAAFIALGIAQQLEKPVVLVCTSGSAAYNYAPAIAEAFFQRIPLLVITADRPPEWIDQWDGQTIRQTNIFGKHVKGSFTFPDEYGHNDKIWHANRIANEAINLACQYPPGPVHINIPLREPFYPDAEELFKFSDSVRDIGLLRSSKELSETARENLLLSIPKFKKVLIIPGQQKPNNSIKHLLEEIIRTRKATVVSDSISNMQSGNTINLHDHFLGMGTDPVFTPDLIISFGKSIISKSLKAFLRKSQAEHWHIQPDGYVPDTYQHLSKIIQSNETSFLRFLLENGNSSDHHFTKAWIDAERKIAHHLPSILSKAKFGEYSALAICLEAIPQESKLHVANSMAVRYVNLLGKRDQEIICNRGTSGIDGSNSTAVGCTFTTKDPVTLITGDMAFFYDRNAFWHNYKMSNLRIILLNNHAGGIFRLIDGPSKQPELEEYFETKQRLSAGYLAKDFGFEYHLANDKRSLEMGLKDFYRESINPKILEIETESPKNAEILKWIKSEISKI